MFKKIFLCCLIFILVGCTKSQGDINIWIDDYLVKMSKEEINIVNNHRKKYYEYYIPTNISNVESTDTHNLLRTNNIDIIINLDITSIINRELYSNYDIEKNIYGDDCLVYTNDRASFRDILYNINIYEIHAKYLIEIRINDMILVSMANLDDIPNVLRQMLIVGSSVVVDKDAVIANFSHKDIIDYQKEQIDLFEMIVPKDGLLIELIDPNVKIEPEEELNPEETEPAKTDSTEMNDVEIEE